MKPQIFLNFINMKYSIAFVKGTQDMVVIILLLSFMKNMETALVLFI